ncbi:MAG: hypothetical protein R2747_01555 [Pyrinomonadaceae bacterium]
MFDLKDLFRRAKIICFCLLPFALCLGAACSSEPADLRPLAPADALVYLETRDLGKTLKDLTEVRVFRENAANSKDFSSLEGIQAAVAVTGFETSEKQVTGENAILNFKPRFVVIADTHLWSWQASGFAEEGLGNFVNETYGGEVELEVTGKDGGEWYEWTARDGRQVFAFVEGSRIFFSNDETALEKCLAVKRGGAESLMKNEGFRRASDTRQADAVAWGYVSGEGVAQMANLAGVSAAIEATEEGDGRSFIARVLPQILRNTTSEIVWTARRTEEGMEDNYAVSLKPEAAGVFRETLVPPAEMQNKPAEFLPPDVFSATRYSLKDPLIAWRSLLLKTKESTDQMSGEILEQFSDSLLEPYGVADAEAFLESIGSDILTAQLDAEGDRSAVVATVKDAEKLKKSIGSAVDFKAAPEKKGNAEVWTSKEGDLAVALAENVLVLGDKESVEKCLEAAGSGQNFTKTEVFQKFAETKAAAVTFGRDPESAEKIIPVLGTPKEGAKPAGRYLTQTNFTQTGVERRTISDFGLIGTILKQVEE